MRHFIRKLRKKPTHIRERIALGSTAIGALVLILFWVTIVRYEILPEQKLAESKSPFRLLADVFKDSYKSTVANVSDFANYENNTPKGVGRLIVVPQEEIPQKKENIIENNNDENENLEISGIDSLEDDTLENLE